MKTEQTKCSETLAHKLQMPVNHPEESIQHSEHGQSLKSRKYTPVSTHYFQNFSTLTLLQVADFWAKQKETSTFKTATENYNYIYKHFILTCVV
jgi:hypothetical protein